MKKTLVLAVALAVTLSAGLAAAGTAKPNNDLSGSKQLVYKTCEGSGVKWIGVVYNDLKGSDSMDAASVICKSKSQGEYQVPNSDFGDRALVSFKCGPYENGIGIAYKDREGKDAADGVTIICKDKFTGAERIVYNSDIQGGRQYVEIKDNNAIGIAYADRMGNDETDGLTLVTK